MKKSKKFFAVITAAALAVSMAGCGSSTDTTPETSATVSEESTDTVEKVKEPQPSVTAADADTHINFTDAGVDIDGQGAEAADTVVTITDAGKYAVSGSVTGGGLIVAAGDDDEVTLILDSADITNEEDAAIYIENAKTAAVIMADGSENRLQSGEETEIDLSSKNSSDEDASGAALQAKCDLEISGNGTLRVLGYINNGIQSSDNITVKGGTIEVTAVHHGIKGNDSITVNDGDITVTAMQDGLHSDDSICIADGNITIASADDGIHADNELTIEDGTIDITESYEGLEADVVLLAGGVINVTSTEDGINATDGSGGGFGFGGMNPGDIEFPEDFEFPEGFDPSEAFELPDDFEFPEGFGGRGDMDRGDMPEGFGGRGNMNPEDMPEGFGDRGDMNREDMPDRPNGFGGTEVDKDSLPVIRITGGTLTVNAGGDGIDSNGNLYVEGGVVIVNGPVSSVNGALDYGSENGGECLISGGTVLALGSSGMAETFGADSSQCSFICNLDSSFDEGDALTITAEDGTVLFEYEVIKKGSSVVFSSPDLNVGDTLTLTVGDQSTEISLDSVSTSVGGRTGFGGFGGMGGMRQ